MCFVVQMSDIRFLVPDQRPYDLRGMAIIAWHSLPWLWSGERECFNLQEASLTPSVTSFLGYGKF